MKCPYCAEDIKDEAIVCRYCNRDLTLYKPVDTRLKAIESQLTALGDCVTKMSAFLDRTKTEEITGKGDDGGTPKKMRKPTFWRKLLLAGIQIVFALGLVFGSTALQKDLRPEFSDYWEPTLSSAEESPELREKRFEEAFQAYEIENERRIKPVLRIFIASLFALPIVLGLWAGLRWHGRNLRAYISGGLICALIDTVLMLIVLVVILVEEPTTRGTISRILLYVVIDVFRCVFGFVTGGLIGDWIERRKYPQFYGRGFSDLLTGARRESARGFDRLTGGFGRFATSIAPLVPLMVVLITSSVGFYTAQQAAKKDLEKKKEPEPLVRQEQEPKAPNRPAATPQPSP